jgi:hypothetical protein
VGRLASILRHAAQVPVLENRHMSSFLDQIAIALGAAGLLVAVLSYTMSAARLDGKSPRRR